MPTPTEVTAGQSYKKHPDEVAGIIVSFAGKLRQGEVITGTPTVSTSAGPTLSSASANTGPVQVLGQTCPPGTAVTFTMSGGTAGTTYSIKVTVSTSGSQTRVLICTIEVANS